jgi:hypothetical protein
MSATFFAFAPNPHFREKLFLSSSVTLQHFQALCSTHPGVTPSQPSADAQQGINLLLLRSSVMV